MNAPVRSSPHLSAIPTAQNTAPVAEFRCLFTHDVRRKQKRWQDGYLKFHSFNSRVMVYDTARNFIGETYWKGSSELQDGDELNLDKGVMVQVEDALGVTQTDLTPLFEKKTKDSPQGKVAPRPLTRPPALASNVPRTGSQLRHKPLNALLGTPKGPIGKAVTMQSPYETRIEKENEWEAEREAKRQKTAHASVDLTLSSPIKAGNTTGIKPLPLWARTSDAKRAAAAPPKPAPRAVAPTASESEFGHISSYVTLPSTSTAIETPRPQLVATSVPAPRPKSAVQKEAPLQTTSHPPQAKIRLPQPKPKTPPRPPPSSPPVSASNRISNVDIALQPVEKRTEKIPAKKPVKKIPKETVELSTTTKEPSRSASPRRDSKSKSLRLSTGTKRGMLLCQAVPQQDRTPIEAPKAPPKQRKKKETPKPRSSTPDSFPSLSDDDELLAQLSSKTSGTSSLDTEKRKAPATTKHDVPPKKSRPRQPSPQPSPDAFEDMETMQGFLDAQLIASPLPPNPKEDTKPKSPPPKAKKTRKPPPKEASSKQTSIVLEDSPPPAPAPKGPKPKAAVTRKVPAKHSARSISPALSIESRLSKQSSLEPQRSASASLSPSKILALSTGGFRKKAKPRTKAVQPQTTTNPDLIPPPAPRPIGVPLPPHPLQANKAGPLMSTTELSAQLIQPARKRKIINDPIEDGTQDGISPNRSGKLKRVRSEGSVDAPISSTSEKWEQRNLPPISGKIDVVAPPAAQIPKSGGLAALIKRTDPRRRFQRTVSLNMDTSAEALSMPGELGSVGPLEKVDDDKGPWSTEAFDLFDWRPPVKSGEEADKGIGMLVDS